MGVIFHHDRNVHACLSEQLTEKLHDLAGELMQLKEKKVPIHLLLLYMQFLVVPTVNYGPFVDFQDTENDYKEIDAEIVQLTYDLLSHSIPLEIVHKFLIAPHEA